MKKISFRVRNFDKEQFLTFNIDNNAELDEELLDYLEEEEPEGIVPVIFEEGEEFDTFSYDITDKIHLNELSNQEINAEMVLKVLRGLVLSMMNMSEYRIPLSYLVLNRRYIYIDSEYKVEFVCIPLEDMKEEVDLTHFLRSFLASLRFDPLENGDYVAKLLTYINNRSMFNLHNLLELVEEWMDNLGIEIPDGESNEIYGEYTEIYDEPEKEETVEEPDEETVGEATENYDGYAKNETIEEEPVSENAEVIEEDTIEETAGLAFGGETAESTEEPYAETVQDTSEDDSSSIWESEKSAYDEPIVAESVVDEPEETVAEKFAADGSETVDEQAEDDVSEEAEPAEINEKKKGRTKNKEVPKVVVLDDELDAFLSEKEAEDNASGGIKFKKNIKINRASIVQNTKDELKAHEAEAASENEAEAEADKDIEEPEKKEPDKKEPAKRRGRLRRNKSEAEADVDSKESGDSEGDEVSDNENAEDKKDSDNRAAKPAANPIPKVNPYLIRVNTDERIMINKQTFKIGKAGMGVDYTISGNAAISRLHAIITGKDGEYFIKDNKSTNHTFVNGKIVNEGESEKLTNNCKIVFGDEEFIFKEQ